MIHIFRYWPWPAEMQFTAADGSRDSQPAGWGFDSLAAHHHRSVSGDRCHRKPGGNPPRRRCHGPSTPPPGHHGEISTAPKRGQWVARCRLRGFDGVTARLSVPAAPPALRAVRCRTSCAASAGSVARCCDLSRGSAKLPTSGWARSASAAPTRPPTRTPAA